MVAVFVLYEATYHSPFCALASVQSSLLFAAFAEVALGCKPTFRTLRFSLPAILGSIAVIWCCSVVWSLAIAPLNFLRSFEFHQVGRQCVEFRLHKRLAALGHAVVYGFGRNLFGLRSLKAHSPLRRLLAFGYFVGATFLLRVRLGFAFHELLQR